MNSISSVQPGDIAAWLWGIAIRRLVSRLRTRGVAAAVFENAGVAPTSAGSSAAMLSRPGRAQVFIQIASRVRVPRG